MRVTWAAIPLLALIIGGVSLVPPAITHASTQGHSVRALWTVTRQTSSHPDPERRHVCLNLMGAPAELWSCAGTVRAPEIYRAATETVSCTSVAGKQTMSVVVSNDGNTIHNRSEFEPDIPTQVDPAIRKLLANAKTWAESTMTYEGVCPAPLKDEQSFVVIKPDGTVFDPFKATACMVDALKTIDGVTEPKAGYVWDPADGPLPFVRYIYPSRSDRRPTAVTFKADDRFLDDPAKGQFIATMSGLSSPSEEPDDFGAKRIFKVWNARCGVTGNIAFP